MRFAVSSAGVAAESTQVACGDCGTTSPNDCVLPLIPAIHRNGWRNGLGRCGSLTDATAEPLYSIRNAALRRSRLLSGRRADSPP
jgi:hypothetical protein